MYRCLGLGVITGMVGFAIAWPWVWPSIARFFLLPMWIAGVLFFLFLLWQSFQLALFCALAEAAPRWRALGPPLAWVTLEWFFPKLFPWQLGLALQPHLPFVQPADLAGTALLSFLVMLVNALLVAGRRTRRSRERIAAVGLALAIPLVMEGYGRARIETVEATDAVARKLRVGIVQGNLPATHRPSREFIDRSFEVLSAGTGKLARDRHDLIVWPEASLRVDLTRDLAMRQQVAELAEAAGSLLLIGAGGRSADGGETSSAFLFSPSGDVVGGYSKVRLFPFVERIPRGLEFVRGLLPGSEIAAGDAAGALLLPGTRAAPSICYEATFPGFFLPAIEQGAQFAVNMTNDVWFGDSSGPHHHLQAAVLRAVESRRWVVRAANSGVSAVISASGRITAATDLFVEATLAAEIPLRDDRTFYARHGDWFVYVCLFALVLVLVVERFAGRFLPRRALSGRFWR